MVRAKFTVWNTENMVAPEGAKRVSLTAVFESKPNGEFGQGCEENRIFGEATPSGEISMVIVNPAAFKQFEIGKYYYVDFTEAP